MENCTIDIAGEYTIHEQTYLSIHAHNLSVNEAIYHGAGSPPPPNNITLTTTESALYITWTGSSHCIDYYTVNYTTTLVTILLILVLVYH